jgi:hypothetical protein
MPPVPLPIFTTLSVCCVSVNPAVTVFAASTVTEHVPVPVQPPPDHPVNVEPVAGIALSVTIVPKSYDCEQSAPQSMPAMLELTVPLPLPDFATVSAYVFSVNVAVTAFAIVIGTTHDAVPVQPPPLQPVNDEPADGVALSVTIVPKSKSSVQSLPQLMPVGDEVTVPVPLPAFITVSVCFVSVNVAVNVTACVSVTMHVGFALPLHAPPDHCVNVEPVEGVAVSVIMLL